MIYQSTQMVTAIVVRVSHLVSWLPNGCPEGEGSSLINGVSDNSQNCHSHFGLIAGSLVERNTMPQGFKLTNPFAVAKSDATDLVELAREIQRVSTVYVFACCR